MKPLRFTFTIRIIKEHVNKYFNKIVIKQTHFMRSAVFWVITRRRVVIVYRRFGTTYRSRPHGSRVIMGKKAYNIDSGKYGGVAIRVM
jgi:hypothetical protein